MKITDDLFDEIVYGGRKYYFDAPGKRNINDLIKLVSAKGFINVRVRYVSIDPYGNFVDIVEFEVIGYTMH